ncbi:MAG: DUF424 family protein [Nitrososphaerota archaeon]|nr:DUF424 family protein [Nitrososphaerota archaeon]
MKFRESLMVNVCDAELLGRRVEEGGLNVVIDESYFAGELVDDGTAIASLRNCGIANLVGERIVAKAVSERLADPNAIRTIGGVPFLMIYKFSP